MSKHPAMLRDVRRGVTTLLKCVVILCCLCSGCGGGDECNTDADCPRGEECALCMPASSSSLPASCNLCVSSPRSGGSCSC